MKKLHIAFLWHQHQPMYKNPSTGVYELPWVRLHATKDYYDTVAILDEFPAIKSNFNLVPSLLAQLDEYAQGTARDRFMDLTLKPADTLTEEDKIFILSNFFMANWGTMVFPYPRYGQLLEKRGRHVSTSEIKRIQVYFKPAEMRDLQVWFNLAWMDPYWKTHDELVRTLFAKGSNFTEDDKQLLVKKQLEICGRIVGKYREMQDRGQIEVSTTPFYHPILPLLCDTNNALGATPQITLPAKRFQHREDAKIQVQKAVDYYTRCFGRPPRGMWPAEGSVAEEVIPLFAEAGVKWIATDEEILFRTNPALSLSRRNLFKPYHLSVMNSGINIMFRDHGLSDAIGFIYTKWNAHDAVNDFMRKLHDIRNSLSDSTENNLVSIILDGENCWEYYANDGWDFLRMLYTALSNDHSFETVTLSDYLDRFPPVDTLKTIFPGSWINGNYGIWIGHTEDNQAWTYLAETRKFLADHVAQHPEKQHTPDILAAWEKIYIAEGSDWNWWYGDDHGSDNDATFDYLFRQHLISVYELLGEKVPDHLHKAIKGMVRRQPVTEPIDLITPRIDGKVSNYFEWQSAGSYLTGQAGGAMHQVDTLIKSFHYGFDLENLYFRIDLNVALNDPSIADYSFKIVFLDPHGREIAVTLQPEGIVKECMLTTPAGIETLTSAAAKKIIEFSCQLHKLKVSLEAKTLEFVVVAHKQNLEVERWPYQSSIAIPVPSSDFTLKTWSV